MPDAELLAKIADLTARIERLEQQLKATSKADGPKSSVEIYPKRDDEV